MQKYFVEKKISNASRTSKTERELDSKMKTKTCVCGDH